MDRGIGLLRRISCVPLGPDPEAARQAGVSRVEDAVCEVCIEEEVGDTSLTADGAIIPAFVEAKDPAFVEGSPFLAGVAGKEVVGDIL